MKTTLVVMAAGLGSRYGGIKQLEPIGPNGEIIMDYSIYDAVRAGFDQIVIVIRKDIEEDFMQMIGNRLKEQVPVEVSYVYQDPDCLPEGFERPADRTKPWGTGQAVLACRGIVEDPFLVINADDFYGEEVYRIMHCFLADPKSEKAGLHFSLAGYQLGNTLSENGTVTRGICVVDPEDYLQKIEETYQIGREEGRVSGKHRNGESRTLTVQETASMNMMGLTPGVFAEFEERFVRFLGNMTEENHLTCEFLLPTIIGEMLEEGAVDVKVLRTKEKWFGVTYKEDKAEVVNALRELLEKGVYPIHLWEEK